MKDRKSVRSRNMPVDFPSHLYNDPGLYIVCGFTGGIGTTQKFMALGTHLIGWLDTEKREAILREKLQFFTTNLMSMSP